MRARANDPDQPAPEPSGATQLVDGLLDLLEEAGVPTDIIDQIVGLVELWECYELSVYDSDEPPPVDGTEPDC